MMNRLAQSMLQALPVTSHKQALSLSSSKNQFTAHSLTVRSPSSAPSFYTQTGVRKNTSPKPRFCCIVIQQTGSFWTRVAGQFLDACRRKVLGRVSQDSSWTRVAGQFLDAIRRTVLRRDSQDSSWTRFAVQFLDASRRTVLGCVSQVSFWTRVAGQFLDACRRSVLGRVSQDSSWTQVANGFRI
jgi:hypothetical protein